MLSDIVNNRLLTYIFHRCALLLLFIIFFSEEKLKMSKVINKKVILSPAVLHISSFLASHSCAAVQRSAPRSRSDRRDRETQRK
jgi:hypothetical protein